MKSHNLLLEHYEKHLKQKPLFSMQLKPEVGSYGIETFVFKPTKSLPFWKLCTVGVSDFIMPERKINAYKSANPRNEYMMFVDPNVKISKKDTEWLRLYSILQATAQYAIIHNTCVTVTDSFEFNDDKYYAGAVLLLPEIFKKSDIVKCYTSKKNFITIFQVMPITKDVLEEKLNRKDGMYWILEQFYTHDDDYNLIGSRPLTYLYPNVKDN